MSVRISHWKDFRASGRVFYRIIQPAVILPAVSVDYVAVGVHDIDITVICEIVRKRKLGHLVVAEHPVAYEGFLDEEGLSVVAYGLQIDCPVFNPVVCSHLPCLKVYHERSVVVCLLECFPVHDVIKIQPGRVFAVI